MCVCVCVYFCLSGVRTVVSSHTPPLPESWMRFEGGVGEKAPMCFESGCRDNGQPPTKGGTLVYNPTPSVLVVCVCVSFFSPFFLIFFVSIESFFFRFLEFCDYRGRQPDTSARIVEATRKRGSGSRCREGCGRRGVAGRERIAPGRRTRHLPFQTEIRVRNRARVVCRAPR